MIKCICRPFCKDTRNPAIYLGIYLRYIYLIINLEVHLSIDLVISLSIYDLSAFIINPAN